MTAKEISESYAAGMAAQRLKEGIIAYAKQEVKERDEQIKRLLLAATICVRITSVEDYNETIEKGFEALSEPELK